MNTTEWRALIRALRARFPVELPVIVYRRPIRDDGDFGVTRFDGRQYRIRINSNHQYDVQVDTLLHEWAHAIAIEEAYGHKGRWAEMHGEIYDSWTKEFK